jgi:predicted deacylase
VCLKEKTSTVVKSGEEGAIEVRVKLGDLVRRSQRVADPRFLVEKQSVRP